MSNIVSFMGYDCEVIKAQYQNGVVALRLVSANTENNAKLDTFVGEPIATATINVPDSPIVLGENETFIKDENENEGMLKALVKAGVVEDLQQVTPVGYYCAYLVKVII